MSDSDEAAIGIEELPHIDEHAIAVRVEDPALVWSALGEAIRRGWRVPGAAARALRVEPEKRSGDPLIAGSTIPGFTVVRAEPGAELALGGRHRFSSYALVFRLIAGRGRVLLSAETRAEFPGPSGRVYRGLVIGTRGHVLAVHGILRAVRRLAERDVATERASAAA